MTISDTVQYNEELIKLFGVTDEDVLLLDPYRKDIGFLVKKRYPPKIQKSLKARGYEDVCAVIEFSARPSLDSSKSNLYLAELKVIPQPFFEFLEEGDVNLIGLKLCILKYILSLLTGDLD